MDKQVTIEVAGVDRPISKKEIMCLLGNIPTGKLDNHERGLISAIVRHFRDCVIGTADDNEDSGTSTDKPTIKERMDYAKEIMRNPRDDRDFPYWTGYFVALTEIRDGDIFSIAI